MYSVPGIIRNMTMDVKLIYSQIKIKNMVKYWIQNWLFGLFGQNHIVSTLSAF